MYKRISLQPNPMRDYILKAVNGHLYLGRWLVSNTYEGWYVTKVSAVDDEWCPMDITPRIIPQKELKIINYFNDYDLELNHRYIPKRVLDEAFQGRVEIPFFATTTDMLCYI